MKISAILMASGVSRRFGEDKAFLPFRDTNFIENILNLLICSKIDEIKAVVNDKIYESLSQKKWDKRVCLLKNSDNLQGQSRSIKLGVTSCKDSDGFMFLALDQPLLTVDTINLVIDNFEPNKIIVPMYGDKKGLPTIFAKKFKSELESISGDIGGRDIIKRHKNLIKAVHVKDEKEGFDVDVREDYDLLKGMV